MSTANGKVARVAIYARVSTQDGRQETENQLRELRAYCERQGYEVYREYVENESGRKGRRERSEFAELFRDAERRRFDLLLFWSLDRFSREGIRKTIHYLQHLDSLGVRFKSHTEPYLDTDNELVSHILLGVLSYFAELEAKKVSERTMAGLERARASGKTLGRPDGFERWSAELSEMKEAGYSQGAMSRETGLSYNTVKKYLRRMDGVEAEASEGAKQT
jgi:DNA invertase Pin-like site-specific DNA recombinase